MDARPPRARAHAAGVECIALCGVAPASAVVRDGDGVVTYAPGIIDAHPKSWASTSTSRAGAESTWMSVVREMLPTLTLPQGASVYVDVDVDAEAWVGGACADAEDEAETSTSDVGALSSTTTTIQGGWGLMPKLRVRVYVAYVRFRGVVPEQSRRKLGATLERAALADTSLCLVSQTPRLDAWMDALMHVYVECFTKPRAHLPGLSVIASQVVERLAWLDERATLFPICGTLVVLTPKRHGELRGVNGEAFTNCKSVLFSHLNVRDIFRCLCAMATERRILLKSENPSTLTRCAEALRALMHPLVWQHVYMPCLPRSMHAYIASLPSTTPYIIGSTSELALDYRRVVILDLDEKHFLTNGGEAIEEVPDELYQSVLSQLRDCIGVSKISADDKPVLMQSEFTAETNTKIASIFSTFWYDLLRLNHLHRFTVNDAMRTATGGHLKLHEYMKSSTFKRCTLITRILDTNAFVSLLEDAETLRKQKLITNEEGTSRGKFRSTQLLSPLVAPTKPRIDRVVSASAFSSLLPRINLSSASPADVNGEIQVDGDVAVVEEGVGMDAVMHRTSHDLDTEAAQEVTQNDGGTNESKLTNSSSLAKRASWAWIRDKIKRRMGSDSLPSDRLLSKVLKTSEIAENFDWYYDTMTKKDAAMLRELVQQKREFYDQAEEADNRDPVFEQEDDGFDNVDGSAALVYPVFASTDAAVADALAQHAANRDYKSLLAGLARQVKLGTNKLFAVASTLRAVVMHADSAGDSKSIAHALLITRVHQPTNVRQLWLSGATRWDDENLWRSLMSFNDEHEWLKGIDVMSYNSDIVCCFALVGLTSSQSSVLLNVLEPDILEICRSSTSTIHPPGKKTNLTLNTADTYASISFESWIENLREITTVDYGVRSSSCQHAIIPDCCPADVTETSLWSCSAITALAVQSGVVSSLVVVGGGYGEIAFWAPESGTVTRGQSHTDNSPISAMTFVPRCANAFVGRQNGSIEIWDSVTGACTYVVPEAHDGKRVSFTSSVVNQVISSAPLTASAGNDGSVKLWDARQKAQNRATSVIRGHKGGVTAFATRDARGGAVGSILTGDESGVVRAWDPRHAAAGPVALARAHNGKVTAIAPLQRSDMTASAGQDCVIRVLRLDGERGGDISLCGHLSDITSLAVLQDDTKGREPVGSLVSGSDDGYIRVWSGGEVVNDVREPWRCVSNTRAHIGAVSCMTTDAGTAKRSSVLSFKSNESAKDAANKMLLSASVDHSFASWKLSTLNSSWLPSTMSAPAKDCAFNATCSIIEGPRRRLFTGDRFGTIRATICPE